MLQGTAAPNTGSRTVVKPVVYLYCVTLFCLLQHYNMSSECYYAVLEISRNADENEIKKA